MRIDASSWARLASTLEPSMPAARPERATRGDDPIQGRVRVTGNQNGSNMAEHPNVARIKDGYAAFAKGDFATLNDLTAVPATIRRQNRSGRRTQAPRYGSHPAAVPAASLSRGSL